MIGATVTSEPRSPEKVVTVWSTKFTTASSTGTHTGMGLPLSRLARVSMAFSKSAPGRSILFTKITRGMLNRLAWRHTVSV